MRASATHTVQSGVGATTEPTDPSRDEPYVSDGSIAPNGSRKRASGLSDSRARWKATQRAVSETSSMSGMQLERTPRGARRTASFTESILGWQGILRGESEDFGACGATALDEWAANVVARVLGSPMLANGLRRELRKRGVAAFGLVADAA